MQRLRDVDRYANTEGTHSIKKNSYGAP